MGDVILKIRGLYKKFGDFTAVKNLSLEIRTGEILGLLGPNGAGKTTTIQILLGVMDPTKGDIVYFGKQFNNNREEILKQINFSSTYISLPWLFTISEILDVFARLYEIPDRKKRIKKLLGEFDIEHLIKKQFYMLSSGEKTRLLLVKAFLNYPRILLLDEPTASLDPDVAIKIREFLKKERKEYDVSMLFTSHNMSEVEEMCDRILILNHGSIIEEGTPETLVKKISTCEIELVIIDDAKKAFSFLKERQLSFKHEKFRFKIPIDEKEVASLLISLANENINYEEISINKPDLEDYFIQLIERNKKQ